MRSARTSRPALRWSTWAILGGWLVVLAAVGPLAGQLAGEQVNDTAAYAPHDAESSQVRELLAEYGADTGLPAVVVYHRAGGLSGRDQAVVAEQQELFAAETVGVVGEPVPTPDGEAVLIVVDFDDEDAGYRGAQQLRELAETDLPAGLAVYVTGPAGFVVDSARAFLDVELTQVLATVAAVALLLLISYRSPVLWLVPLVGILVAVAAAQGVVYLLVVWLDLTISGMTQGILTALVFGAGTDYALLLTARYREELRRHADRYEAVLAAVRRSGPALLASGGTVVLAMLCLLLAEMTTNRSIGPVGAAGIVVTMLVMLTLFPAMLALLGRWVFWPRVPRYTPSPAAQPSVDEPPSVEEPRSVWHRVAQLVGRGPRPVWVVTALVLVAMSAGLLGARVGVPMSDTFTHDPPAIAGQQVLAEHYPGGSSLPADVVVAAGASEQVAELLAGVAGVAEVGEPTRYGPWEHLPVVLADPPESAAAEATVGAMRAALADRVDGVALVGGETATSVDTDAATARDVRRVIPLVLGLILLVLIVLLRAIVAPALLLGTVILSNASAFGLAWLLFDRVLGLPGFDNQAVLLGFVFLVALGIDYNIFLVSRAREEVARHGHRAGVLRALTSTGAVITCAGLILAAAFTLLGVIPVVLTVQLGFIVAVGVLIDTFLVRSLLTPALLLELGRASWWPGNPARESC
ncbi:MMPL family transporter [Natronosporangium hydrolyticum]|uniref:MMPL family transporter n=1 Tax=Natronosporangium hydrolyticum TaxID=2811111 RepID=A0A895YCH1_9ACTN|nr:MMPL family transporter [Natronosporangium hydrolyticum]QSB13029.1 MMPL family transporter [Natronosporangium hydrolyticum]